MCDFLIKFNEKDDFDSIELEDLYKLDNFDLINDMLISKSDRLENGERLYKYPKKQTKMRYDHMPFSPWIQI